VNLREALDYTVDCLEKAAIPDARLDAEYLVSEASRTPRMKLGLNGHRALASDAEPRLARWIQERLERRPLAYILGDQPFMNLILKVTPAVLIPRPETELLVEEALRLLDQHPEATVVDVGTGSGNIVLSLAKHPHAAQVHAVDISGIALELAKENALRNQVRTPIQWHLGDLLIPLIDLGVRADIITANLPYVRTQDIMTLQPEVRWEPSLALDGGRNGLAYIGQVIEQAEKVLNPEGVLLLEIGSDQGTDVLALFQKGRSWQHTELFNDLAGLPRWVRAKKGVPVGSFNH
jgi:release factor glutamine methyltransferase